MVLSSTLYMSRHGSLCALHFCVLVYGDSVYHLNGTICLVCNKHCLTFPKKKRIILKKNYLEVTTVFPCTQTHIRH